MEELNLGGDLTYSERPVKILYTAERLSQQGYHNVQGPVESPHLG
jgi:hypothetical protein